MKIKNETEIQLLKIFFKTSGGRATKNITSKRAYPYGLERKYYNELKSFFAPLTKYVNKYISENMEPLLRGDSEEIRLDAIPGDSFRNMIYNLENWLSIYMPDISEVEGDNNNVILTSLGKTANEAMKFGEKEFEKTLQKGINVSVPTTAEWWNDMRNSWTEDNYTLITSNAKNYVSKINTLTEQAIVNGMSPRKLKDEILKATESLSDKHCKLLARDQMGKLNGQITQAQMQEVGLDMYVWSTSYDDRVRDSHALMEGLLCRWDDASVCSYDNGKTWVSRPSGAVELHPGQDIQCRCVPLAFYPELEAEMYNIPMEEVTEDLPDVQDLPEFQTEKEIKYTNNEKESVAYWVEGNNGWAYQDIRKIANGLPIEDTSLVNEQLKLNNLSKAENLKIEMDKIYKNFESAVNKSPSPNSEFLYRIEPGLKEYSVGNSIDFDKYLSFTYKPTDSFFNNFNNGENTTMFVLKNSKNFADISKIGRDTLNIGTQEFEAISRNPMTYKIVAVENKKINGINYKVISLEYEKTNEVIKKKYVPLKIEKPKVDDDFELMMKKAMELVKKQL